MLQIDSPSPDSSSSSIHFVHPSIPRLLASLIPNTASKRNHSESKFALPRPLVRERMYEAMSSSVKTLYLCTTSSSPLHQPILICFSIDLNQKRKINQETSPEQEPCPPVPRSSFDWLLKSQIHRITKPFSSASFHQKIWCGCSWSRTQRGNSWRSSCKSWSAPEHGHRQSRSVFVILPAMSATSSSASSHSTAQSSVQAVQPTADLSRRSEQRKKSSGGERREVGQL